MPRSILALGISFVLSFALVAPTVVGQDASSTVTNVAPTITSITINSGTTITPTAASNISVTFAVVASDENGNADISSIAWTVTNPDAAAFASATITDFSTCTSSGMTRSCTPTFTVGYFHKPGTYTFAATVTDAAGATGTLSVTQTVASIRGLALDVTSVSFGSLAPSAVSAIKTVQVLNRGNSAIDIEVSGTALSKSTTPTASVAVGSLTRSLASNMTGAVALTGTPAAVSTFSLAYGMGVKKPTYWQLTMPSGSTQFIPPGSYTGTITIGAIADA